jgi:CheY-like chemotaxis protein
MAEDNKCKAGDLIFISRKIAYSDVPFVVEGGEKLKDLIEDKDNDHDRRKNYIDSSIWLRYANDEETENAIKEEFKAYYILGLYNTSRAKENREFNSRLLRNSHLENFDGGHGNDVAPFIFHSETEMKIEYKKWRKKLRDTFKGSAKKEIKWRILLVDDHATETTAEKNNKNNENKKLVVSKCKIIQYWFSDLGFKLECGMSEKEKKRCKNICDCTCHCNLKKTFEKDEKCHCDGNPNKFEDNESEFVAHIECVETIENAKEALQTKKYDLILLDYLMKEKKESEEISRSRYSHEILKKIKDVFEENLDEKINSYENDKEKWLLSPIEEKYQKEKEATKLEKMLEKIEKETSKLKEKIKKNIDKFIVQKKGSNGRFRFLFMSAFVNAVQSHMLQLGLLPHTPYWDLGHGACPTTTPNLFKYHLIQTMYDQVNGMINLYNISKSENSENEKRVFTLIDLLSIIYENESQARQNAIDYFNALLKMRLNYDIFKYDACIDNCEIDGKMKPENQSLLIKSLFPDIKYYDNAFWEHTMQLVYLTAFGTIRQWHDMWEEFMLIRPYLQKIQKYDDERSINKKAEGVISAIENYITNLQRAASS